MENCNQKILIRKKIRMLCVLFSFAIIALISGGMYLQNSGPYGDVSPFSPYDFFGIIKISLYLFSLSDVFFLLSLIFILKKSVTKSKNSSIGYLMLFIVSIVNSCICIGFLIYIYRYPYEFNGLTILGTEDDNHFLEYFMFVCPYCLLLLLSISVILLSVFHLVSIKKGRNTVKGFVLFCVMAVITAMCLTLNAVFMMVFTSFFSLVVLIPQSILLFYCAYFVLKSRKLLSVESTE